ncbi:MAG: lytic transglycosylase domain-containing protein [Deltaproteobacteria bacterium]|nr:lytic transglycosylase domain-containing protein [Deltaproteobacteria bacterium]
MRRFCHAVLAVVLAAVVPAQADTPPLGEDDIAHYRSAFYHAEKNQWRDAEIWASRASDPVLVDVITWMRMKDDWRAPFDDILAFMETRPEWPSQDMLRRNAEDVMPDTLKSGEVLAHFARWPPLTDRGVLRHIEALVDTGREDEARAAVLDAWQHHTFKAAGERSFLRRYGAGLQPENHRERVDRLIWQGDTAAARRILTRLDDDGLAALGEARIRLKNREWGVDAAISRVPAHLIDDEALLFERVDWRLGRGRHDAALELVLRLPHDIGQPDRWALQRLRIAGELMARGDMSGAYDVVADHRRLHDAFHHRAEWLAGWIALRHLDDPVTALGHFSRFHDQVSMPISLARGAYWSARAAAASGNEPLANDWFNRAAEHPQAFYGQLAAMRQGIHLTLPTPPVIDRTAADDGLFLIVRRLTEVREWRLAETFLQHMARTAVEAEDLEVIAATALDLDLPHAAVRVAKAAAKQGVVMPAAGYPIIALPETRGVDADLVLAVINRESEFNRRAISGSAAYGLMQLRLATARATAARLGVETSRELLLGNSRHNIRLGTAYLRRLISNYRGSLVLALAAYNGGSGNVGKWIRRSGRPDDPHVDAIDWIESIPYRETRNYVQRVIEAMQVYRMLRGEKPVDLFPVTGSS